MKSEVLWGGDLSYPDAPFTARLVPQNPRDWFDPRPLQRIRVRPLHMRAQTSRLGIAAIRCHCSWGATYRHRTAGPEADHPSTISAKMAVQHGSHLVTQPLASFFKVTSLECLSDFLRAQLTSNWDIKRSL